MTALLLESLLKSSVLLGTGLLLRLAWRRPALRHMTLATVLTGALALPAAIALLPAWSPPGLLQASWKTEAGDDLDASAMASVGAPIGPRAALDVTPTTGSQLLAGLRLPPTWTLWMIGVGLALVPSIAGRLRRTRLVRTALPLSRGRARRVARLVGKELGIRHEVRLLAAREEMLPATWGWVRPRVVLPAAAAGWSSHRLQTVLRHELAHVARHDALFRGLAEACCALLWFQPLSWMAARRLRLDQELACDAMVVAVGTDRHDYARELPGDRPRAPDPAGRTGGAGDGPSFEHRASAPGNHPSPLRYRNHDDDT